jgi:nucleotide-binding universal stress UspA family protein
MYKNILIPVALDHGANIDTAISVARKLQSKDAKITLVAVIEDVPSYVAEYASVKPEQHIMPAIKERLKAYAEGQANFEVAIMTGKPGVAIPDLAEETDADLIVIGSHKPGVEDYFLGSTASRVVRRAPCAVMVIR